MLSSAVCACDISLPSEQRHAYEEWTRKWVNGRFVRNIQREQNQINSKSANAYTQREMKRTEKADEKTPTEKPTHDTTDHPDAGFTCPQPY